MSVLDISRTGPKTERLTILRTATHETERGDHDFCLSRSHYTDTNPTSRERAATAGINLGPPHQELSALPTELPRPPEEEEKEEKEEEEKEEEEVL